MKQVALLFIFVQLTVIISAQTDNEVGYEAKLDDGLITYKSNTKDQSYSYRVETGDGSVKFENGRLEGENLVVDGGYEYTGDDGARYSVSYVADENGYRPKVSFGTKAAGASAPKYKPTATKRTKSGGNAAFLGSLVGGGIAKRSYMIEKIIKQILSGL